MIILTFFGASYLFISMFCLLGFLGLLKFFKVKDLLKWFQPKIGWGLILTISYLIGSCLLIIFKLESTSLLKDHLTRHGLILIFSSAIEEIWFRGYWLAALEKRHRRVLALILSSVGFFFAHLPWKAGWLPYTGTLFLSFTNSFIVFSDRKLFWSLSFHILCNLLGPVWFYPLGEFAKFFFF
jgi:membrane protease YdiL (CAAX protease family)